MAEYPATALLALVVWWVRQDFPEATSARAVLPGGRRPTDRGGRGGPALDRRAHPTGAAHHHHLATLKLPGDPLVVASMFTTVLSTFAATWLSGEGPDLGRALSDEEAIESLTSFLHAGIGGGQPVGRYSGGGG